MNEHQQQQIRQEAMEELVAFGPRGDRRVGQTPGRQLSRYHQERAGKTVGCRRTRGTVRRGAIEPMSTYIRTETRSAIMTLERLLNERLIALLLETLAQCRHRITAVLSSASSSSMRWQTTTPNTFSRRSA